jgi:hypothetical protein
MMFLAYPQQDFLLVSWAWSCSFSLRIVLEYVYNLLLGKNRLRISFASQGTTMSNHIRTIISITTWSTVRWIYTRWIVTTMQKLLAFWYWSIRQFPCNTMRSQPFFVLAIPDKSIMMLGSPVGNPSSNPNPTRPKFRFGGMNRPILIDLFPKSLRQWNLNKTAIFDVSFHGTNDIVGGLHLQALRGVN